MMMMMMIMMIMMMMVVVVNVLGKMSGNYHLNIQR